MSRQVKNSFIPNGTCIAMFTCSDSEQYKISMVLTQKDCVQSDVEVLGSLCSEMTASYPGRQAKQGMQKPTVQPFELKTNKTQQNSSHLCFCLAVG